MQFNICFCSCIWRNLSYYNPFFPINTVGFRSLGLTTNFCQIKKLFLLAIRILNYLIRQNKRQLIFSQFVPGDSISQKVCDYKPRPVEREVCQVNNFNFNQSKFITDFNSYSFALLQVLYSCKQEIDLIRNGLETQKIFTTSAYCVTLQFGCFYKYNLIIGLLIV